MLRFVKSMMLAGGLGVGLLALGGPVRADIIPTLNVFPSPVMGGFLWEYDAELTSQQFLESGDLFTIYDFAGFVPGSNIQPINWVFSSAGTGITPGGLLVSDSPSLPNLTWTYTGPDTTNGTFSLGLFKAVSSFESLKSGGYAAMGHKWSKIGSFQLPDHGQPTMNKGPVTVPAGVVPEPGTMALLGLGAAPLLGKLRRRFRKA
jgi:hypothetical protein